MKKILPIFSVFLILSVFSKSSFAQAGPVMYFCESYDADRGEIGISNRFTKGYLTVVVKSDYSLNAKNVSVELDKWNDAYKNFKFYKKFNFTIDPDSKYVYFSKNDESDMSFDDPGFYRVFLLNSSGESIASALVEIID
jgi:hypothetical protein